jgi:hypothetical protein
MYLWPGFGNKAGTPDPQTLLALTQAGILRVRAFAGPKHFADSRGFADNRGTRPKWWNDPNATTVKNYVFAKTDANGNYLGETPSRNSRPANRFWSLTAYNWFDEMAAAGISIKIPVLDFVSMAPEEAGRLNFGPEIDGPPVDYPMASFTADLGNELIENSWPRSWVMLIEDGAPKLYTIEELNQHPNYKLNWNPRPANPTPVAPIQVANSGISAAQLIDYALAANGTTAFRRAAQLVLDTTMPDEAKAAALIKLIPPK